MLSTAFSQNNSCQADLAFQANVSTNGSLQML